MVHFWWYIWYQRFAASSFYWTEWSIRRQVCCVCGGVNKHQWVLFTDILSGLDTASSMKSRFLNCKWRFDPFVVGHRPCTGLSSYSMHDGTWYMQTWWATYSSMPQCEWVCTQPWWGTGPWYPRTSTCQSNLCTTDKQSVNHGLQEDSKDKGLNVTW